MSMGGKVLIFPHDIAYDQGIAAGEALGAKKTKKESAFEMFSDGISCEKVAQYIHENVENVRILEKEWGKTGKEL